MPRKTSATPQPNTGSPTALSFNALQTAFDFFNKELFGGRLPPAMILLHRKKNAKGYFWAERFGHRDLDDRIHEIAINPTVMRGRTDRDTLSTLVHEMCHLEQEAFGKPSAGGYHNREWGLFMDRVGLTPTSTGKPGGSRTGNHVTHMIEEGGPFDVACAKLLATGLSLPYSERVITRAEKVRAKAKTASKTKYTCPSCDLNAWGKPGISLICGECGEELEEA